MKKIMVGIGLLMGSAVTHAMAPDELLDSLLQTPCLTDNETQCFRLNERVVNDERFLTQYFELSQQLEPKQRYQFSEAFLQAPQGKSEFIDRLLLFSSIVSTTPKLKYALSQKLNVESVSDSLQGKNYVQMAIAAIENGQLELAKERLYQVLEVDADLEDKMLAISILAEIGPENREILSNALAILESNLNDGGVVSSINPEKEIAPETIGRLKVKLNFDALVN